MKIDQLTKLMQQSNENLSSNLNENSKKVSSELSDLTNYIKSSEKQNDKKFVSFREVQDISSCKFPLLTDEEFKIFDESIFKNISNIRSVMVS